MAIATMPAAAHAEGDVLAFAPVADTYVASDAKPKSFGSATALHVDASPARTALLRFNVSGLSGRAVAGARLRLYSGDASNLGGRVFSMSNTTWTESVTWHSRPSVDGPQRAAFGAVAAGNWYEVQLGPAAVTREGLVSLAIDSTSGDGAMWSTRESAHPPQLLIDLAPLPDAGATTVADAVTGSSDPTFFATQHRLVRTKGGRSLAVFGTHASGIDLAWRDADGAGPWLRTPLLSGTGTGDWPASIAIATTADGVEHAWAVWGGTTGFGEKPKPVEMRRISGLDSPTGPTVGPVVLVAEAGVAGNGRVDIGFERLANGVPRGWLFYVRRLTTTDSSSEQVVRSFDGVGSDAPTLNAPAVMSTTRSPLVATFSEGAALRLAARHTSGALAVYRHDPSAAVGGWTTPKAGVALSGLSRPAAATLPNGDVVVAVESDTTNDVVTVQRFGADGLPQPVELAMTGYREPTIAAAKDGRVVVVAIRAADGALVSRTLAGAWPADDRVELAPGNHQWPNALRQSDGTLRLVVRGPAGGADQSAVVSLVRVL